ncbi:TspO/MBR family protein [Nonomuraea sp. NPDC049784]|uniref:TspO/MBR family protein n=1 Tax=Nonomuraea sp. NPDC049784 TaxID=3154361 RepID=UPI0033CA2F55
MMTTFVKTALAVCTAALTGGWAADPDAPRRRRLDEPWWRPPRQAFALVWTPRYLPIASGGHVPRPRPSRRRASPRPALPLNASTLLLTPRSSRADRRAGPARVPYAGWTLFATAVNAALWRRNR